MSNVEMRINCRKSTWIQAISSVSSTAFNNSLASIYTFAVHDRNRQTHLGLVWDFEYATAFTVVTNLVLILMFIQDDIGGYQQLCGPNWMRTPKVVPNEAEKTNSMKWIFYLYKWCIFCVVFLFTHRSYRFFFIQIF